MCSWLAELRTWCRQHLRISHSSIRRNSEPELRSQDLAARTTHNRRLFIRHTLQHIPGQETAGHRICGLYAVCALIPCHFYRFARNGSTCERERNIHRLPRQCWLGKHRNGLFCGSQWTCHHPHRGRFLGPPGGGAEGRVETTSQGHVVHGWVQLPGWVSDDSRLHCSSRQHPKRHQLDHSGTVRASHLECHTFFGRHNGYSRLDHLLLHLLRRQPEHDFISSVVRFRS